ncbi:MAG TPA: hypothetical protein VGK33_01085, partial [Chloroflexota bacterium]
MRTKCTRTVAKNAAATTNKYHGFTDEERGAMKQRAQELKATARRDSRSAKADAESEVLAKIAEMRRVLIPPVETRPQLPWPVPAPRWQATDVAQRPVQASRASSAVIVLRSWAA